MTVINSNRAVRGPVTAVPLVAGKGVRLTADTQNNRWIVEADETVLWEGSVSGVNAVMNLSEDYTNFERLRFVAKEDNNEIPDYWCEVCANGTYLYPSYLRTNSSSAEVAGMWIIRPNDSNSSLKITGAVLRVNGTTSSTNTYYITKVVGINRIASN